MGNGKCVLCKYPSPRCGSPAQQSAGQIRNQEICAVAEYQETEGGLPQRKADSQILEPPKNRRGQNNGRGEEGLFSRRLITPWLKAAVSSGKQRPFKFTF